MAITTPTRDYNYRFNIIPADEVPRAMEIVKEWGYPRELGEADAGSQWFCYGPEIMFWFETYPQFGLLGYWFHLAVAPRRRKKWPVRTFLLGMEVVAELLGAIFINVKPIDGDGVVPDLLERLGWALIEDEDGRPLYWSKRTGL